MTHLWYPLGVQLATGSSKAVGSGLTEGSAQIIGRTMDSSKDSWSLSLNQLC